MTYLKKLHLFGTMSKKPLVGFGVVGTKTFINSSLVFFEISPLLSFVTNPTTHIPFRGYSIIATLLLLSPELVNVSVICPIAE